MARWVIKIGKRDECYMAVDKTNGRLYLGTETDKHTRVFGTEAEAQRFAQARNARRFEIVDLDAPADEAEQPE